MCQYAFHGAEILLRLGLLKWKKKNNILISFYSLFGTGWASSDCYLPLPVTTLVKLFLSVWTDRMLKALHMACARDLSWPRSADTLLCGCLFSSCVPRNVLTVSYSTEVLMVPFLLFYHSANDCHCSAKCVSWMRAMFCTGVQRWPSRCKRHSFPGNCRPHERQKLRVFGCPALGLWIKSCSQHWKAGQLVAGVSNDIADVTCSEEKEGQGKLYA